MTAPRFEIVQTDAEQPWHARTIAANGRIILRSENYAERRGALDALKITAQLFSVTPAFFHMVGDVLHLSAGGMRVPVVDVDERVKCSGASDCPATRHEHGCYADLDGSACTDPGDHE